MPGEESIILRHRLKQEFGLTPQVFRYSPVSYSMAEITGELERFVGDLKASTVHFVGHSLGGLVIYRFLERFPNQPPGRVVFLGTPCCGSLAAERAGHFGPLARLMGHYVTSELLSTQTRNWAHARPLGIIAGTQALGLGQLFADFKEPNDGTIAVSETHISGATDTILLPVSHFGMLLSSRVARATGTFLTRGSFSLQ